jgi:TRAP-type mannitol/chloroaromatic compound transport system permease small subunit
LPMATRPEWTLDDMGVGMTKLEKSLQIIDRVNGWVGRILSYFVAVMTVLIVIEVVMRYFFNAPTSWNNDLTQMIFGTYAVLAGGFVLMRGGHVNVDILSSHFSPKVQAIIAIVTSPLFFFFCGMLLVYGGSFAWESLSAWETTRSAWDPPAWPVKLMIPLGAILLLLQGIATLIRNIVALFQEQELTTAHGKHGGDA